MKARGEKKYTIVDAVLEERTQALENGFLAKVDKCVNWLKLRTLINKKYTKTQNAVGNPAYDSLMLFKILLLEQWYGLSDYQVEERINDSISFTKFIGLGFEHTAPDHSTISRFRSAITELGLLDKLLAELNKQFVKHRIARIEEGVCVDATIVDTPFCPHKPKSLVVAGDREDTRSGLEKLDELAYHEELKYTDPGLDHEARWVKKGNEYRFGFKHHVLTDINGVVLSVVTTSANVSDTTMFKPLLDTVSLPPATPVLCDKGYSSASNSDYLCAHHLTDGIMHKKPKGKELSPKLESCNRAISAGRYVIERTFGSIHSWMGGGRARYRGLAKVHTQGVLEFMAYNIKRMLRLPIREVCGW